MSAIDISKLSYEELLALTTDAQKLLATQRDAHRAEIVQRIYSQVLAAGFTLKEVLSDLQNPEIIAKLEKAAKAPAKRSTGSRITLPYKYQAPNSASRWSGKGRKPAWVVSHLNAGGKLDDLLIKNESA